MESSEISMFSRLCTILKTLIVQNHIILPDTQISDKGQKRKSSALISGFCGEDQANSGKIASAKWVGSSKRPENNAKKNKP